MQKPITTFCSFCKIAIVRYCLPKKGLSFCSSSCQQKYRKVHTKIQYCTCGCGEIINPKTKVYIFKGEKVNIKTTNKYIEGHKRIKYNKDHLLIPKQIKIKKQIKWKKQIICACGCGEQINGNIYIKNHKKELTRKKLIQGLKNRLCACGCKKKIGLKFKANGQPRNVSYIKGHFQPSKKSIEKVKETKRKKYGYKIPGKDIYSYCPICNSPIYKLVKYCSKKCLGIGLSNTAKITQMNPKVRKIKSIKAKEIYENLSKEEKIKRKNHNKKKALELLEYNTYICKNCNKEYKAVISPNRKLFFCSKKCLKLYSLSYCKCGCGKKVPIKNKQYIKGHQPCECGCGGKVGIDSYVKKYISGHYFDSLSYVLTEEITSKKIKLYWEKWRKENNIEHPDIRAANKICGCGCKKLWASLTEKERKRHRSIKTKKLWEDPEYAKAVSDGCKKRWEDPEYAAKCSTWNPGWQGINKPETELLNLLNRLSPNTFKYCGDGTKWINRKNPDFIRVDGKKKQVVELFGDYWHSEEVIGLDKKEHQEQRINIFGDVGHDCLIIWEHELKNKKGMIKKLNKFI